MTTDGRADCLYSKVFLIQNPSWCAKLSTGRVTRPVGKPEQFAHPQNPKSKMTTSIPTPTQKLPQKFNTLQLLRGGWYATWVASFLLLVVSIYGVSQQRQALKTVGKDSAPSILTAQRLRDSFAEMDASLANELLLKPGQNQQILVQFEKDRTKIPDRLLLASKYITYDEEEPIVQGLQRNSVVYFLKLQEARDTHKLGNAVNTLNVYRSTANIVDNKLLPQAELLDTVNSKYLENAYTSQSNINKSQLRLILLLGLAQLAILVVIQLFLYRRMQRILNVKLLAASAIATIFLGYTVFSFMSATGNLKIAKEDAFNSLIALRKMRALSYMANGDESRYLLDVANAGKHEKSFNTNIDKIIKIPPNLSIQNIVAMMDSKGETKDLPGLFGTVLNNITFFGEKELAVKTLMAWNDYINIDKQIRQLYRSGKVAEAIALCIGDKPGQSNWAFDRYRSAQTNLIDLNKKEFDRHIDMGNDRLAYFEIIATGALGSVAILTLFGLRPRLMEYL
jgi:hypothetical protein